MRWQAIMWLAAALLFAPAAWPAPAMPVVYCMECTESSQFLLSAVAAFGGQHPAPGATRVLVVDPGTQQAVVAELAPAPNGKQVEAKAVPAPARAAIAAALDAAHEVPIFVPSCRGVVQVGPGDRQAIVGPAPDSDGREETPTPPGSHAVERGSLIDLGSGVYGIVLCSGPTFTSYQSHDQAAVVRAIRAATLRRALDQPGAVKAFGAPAAAGGPAPKPMWHPGEVCAVFNDGSSACYGKPPSSAAGAGDGMTIVNHGGSVEYGAPGSKAGAPGTWVTCKLAANVVSGCVSASR